MLPLIELPGESIFSLRLRFSASPGISVTSVVSLTAALNVSRSPEPSDKTSESVASKFR